MTHKAKSKVVSVPVPAPAPAPVPVPVPVPATKAYRRSRIIARTGRPGRLTLWGRFPVPTEEEAV
jgi:hypothetical protein